MDIVSTGPILFSHLISSEQSCLAKIFRKGSLKFCHLVAGGIAPLLGVQTVCVGDPSLVSPQAHL